MHQVTENVEQVPVAAAVVKDALPKDNRAIHEVKGAELEELDALSKEVFGATSRWKTLITKGYVEQVMEEVQEYVPGETKEDGTTGEGFTRMVQVPVKRKDGANLSVHKYHDVTSVRAFLLDCKARLDKIKAEIQRMQEEAKAKKDAEALAKKVHEEAQGSAL